MIFEMFLYIKRNFSAIPKAPFPVEVHIAEYWFMESLVLCLVNYDIHSKSCTAFFISNCWL